MTDFQTFDEQPPDVEPVRRDPGLNIPKPERRLSPAALRHPAAYRRAYRVGNVIGVLALLAVLAGLLILAGLAAALTVWLIRFGWGLV